MLVPIRVYDSSFRPYLDLEHYQVYNETVYAGFGVGVSTRTRPAGRAGGRGGVHLSISIFLLFFILLYFPFCAFWLWPFGEREVLILVSAACFLAQGYLH